MKKLVLITITGILISMAISRGLNLSMSAKTRTFTAINKVINR